VAEILPFRGVRYNQALSKDLSKVICPPYDITSPQLQQELHYRSEYNFVRLEHGRELPQDTTTNNKYTRSAATLEKWLKQGILKVDNVPAIYLHDHFFFHQGKEYRRRGIITRVRLEEWDKMVIRPHEGTLAKSKNDRINLLRALQANTSPIFSLYEDQGQKLSSLLASQATNEPIINSNSADGERHCVWAITEPQVINQICNSFVEQPLYIADGHHRYESALTHQRDKHTYSAVTSGDEAFNFVMMTLVDFSDPGLIILPAHRLLRGISKPLLNSLMTKLRVFFEIEELPLDIPDIWQQRDNSLTGTSGVRLFLFGLVPEHILALRLRNFDAVSQMIPYFHSEVYKKLDVSILDHIILEKLLGFSSGQEETRITFSYDRQDTINRVIDQEYQLAFLLEPLKPIVVKAIADAGDRLPRKSTYFYPKLPAGLVFYRLT